MERRHKERLTSSLDVTIAYEKQLLRTKTVNISADGIFVATPDCHYPVNACINIALTFRQNNRTVVYLLPAYVVRSTKNGTALVYSASESLVNTLRQLMHPQTADMTAGYIQTSGERRQKSVTQTPLHF